MFNSQRKTYAVATFHTTAQALGMKTLAEAASLQGRLAPIPRKLSAGCGFAWLEPVENQQSLQQALDSYDLGYEAITLCEL